jgi:tetratricopeptide (TPR) repeat protein
METPAGNLWLFVKGSEASRAIRAHRLDEAETLYRDIVARFEGQTTAKARQSLAVSYHQLGVVAQERGDLDAAEAWYKRSLAIEEELGNRPGMASSYHQLGMVAQLRGDLGAAEAWYKRSLAIEEELGNRPHMAISYHQLGRVAELRGDLDAAEAWYKRSLAILEELGNRPHMAISYHQLGRVAELRGDTDGALVFAIRACALFDEPISPHSSAPLDLARLHAKLGGDAIARAWQGVTGKPMPAQVLDTLKALAAANAERQQAAGDESNETGAGYD